MEGQGLANPEVLGVTENPAIHVGTESGWLSMNLCTGVMIDSTIESIHKILDLEAQVVAVSISLQPEWTIDIEAALFIRLAHEGSPFRQL